MSIEPVPNVQDVNLRLELSENTVVVKRGKTAILFTSDATRDFVNISATSQQKVFGIEPSILPSALDEGFHVPIVLVALKEKFLSVGGLTSVTVIDLINH